jgi:hypothetical protein
LDNQSAAEDAMGLSTSVGFPDVDPSTLPEFGPYIDADTLDPRGNQIESPTGTGIGLPSTSTTNVSQDLLDQLGGAAGTTIEDLLPSNATGNDGTITVDNMNFQERFDRQSELADAAPGGQNTATGTILPDGSAVDTLVTVNPETGRPETYEATTVAGESPVVNKVTYTDYFGNEYDTLAEAQLNDAQGLNRQLTGIQNIPTQSNYILGGPEQLILARGPGFNQPVQTAINNAAMNQVALDNQAMAEAAMGRTPGSQVQLADTSGLSTGRNIMDTLYNIGGGFVEELGQTAGGVGRYLDESLEGVANAFNNPFTFSITDSDGVDRRYNYFTGEEIDYTPSDIDIVGRNVAQPLKESLLDTSESIYSNISPERQLAQEQAQPADFTFGELLRGEAKDVVGRTYGTDLGSTLMTGAQEIPDLITDALALALTKGRSALAKGLGTGYVIGSSASAGSESQIDEANAAIDAALADGSLQQSDEYKAVAEKFGEANAANILKDTATDQILKTTGPVAGLTDFALGKAAGGIGISNPFGGVGRFVTSAGVEGGTEAVEGLTGNLAQQSAGLDTGTYAQTGSDFVEGLAGGTVSQAGVEAGRAGINAFTGTLGGGPNVDTSGPAQPAAPAAGVISGQSLVPSTQADADAAMGTNVATNVQPTQPVAPSAPQAPNIINIPGTDVVVQSVAPAPPQAPPAAPPSGIESLGTGGAFQLPTTGNVPRLPPPSNVDAQPSVPEIDVSQINRPNVDPEALTAAEILQNEIDIITTDTNTSADEASRGPASIALIEAAQNEGADVKVGDSRADVSSKIVNQVALDNQAAAEEAMGRVDISRINQPAAPESLPNIDLTTPAAPETASMTPSDVDISRINQPAGLPEGIGSLDAAVDAARQNLPPEGIINLEVAQTGDLSLETARKVAEDNNLSMQEVTNMGERAKGLEESKATGPSTDVATAAPVDIVDATPGANQLAAEEAMGREAEQYVFQPEVLPPESNVSVEVEPEAEGDIIEGTTASTDVTVVVDDDVAGTTPPTDTTTDTRTTVTPTPTSDIRGTVDVPEEREEEVEVEVEDPPADDPSGPAQEEEEVEIKIDTPDDDDDDDDDDDTTEDAPFECPEGFEAVQINGEWRCQKIGDDTPKIGRMRPTGGSYYQPRRPSPATTAKAYRFR